MKTLKTTLHTYRFNIDNPDEAAAYAELKSSLEAQGLKVFDTFQTHKDSFDQVPAGEVTLAADFLFSNQWNTVPKEDGKSGLRVFDWAESIFPNRKIKAGHYLTITDEMREIRRTTFKCGYCGAIEVEPTEDYHAGCLPTRYLEEKNLPLLAWTSIDGSRGTSPDMKQLREAWVIEQVTAREQHAADWLEARWRVLQEKERVLEIEGEARLWIAKHPELRMDNLIYYTGKGLAYGWRTPATEKEKAILAEAPFEILIKTSF